MNRILGLWSATKRRTRIQLGLALGIVVSLLVMVPSIAFANRATGIDKTQLITSSGDVDSPNYVFVSMNVTGVDTVAFTTTCRFQIVPYGSFSAGTGEESDYNVFAVPVTLQLGPGTYQVPVLSPNPFSIQSIPILTG
jgi:hypothetical protein